MIALLRVFVLASASVMSAMAETAEYSYVFAGPSVAISQESLTSKILNVPDDCSISKVRTTVEVTHPFIGAVNMYLTSPSATTIQLQNRSSNQAGYMKATYPDTKTPADNLNLFVGENGVGPWILSLTDLAGGASGVLDSWTLYLTQECPETKAEADARIRTEMIAGNLDRYEARTSSDSRAYPASSSSKSSSKSSSNSANTPSLGSRNQAFQEILANALNRAKK